MWVLVKPFIKAPAKKAESCIIEYAQHLQASFFHDGRNEYIIFANKGYTKSEENYQLIRELQKKRRLWASA